MGIYLGVIMKKTYCLAKEYTKNPGARYKTQGPYSGEDFREKMSLSGKVCKWIYIMSADWNPFVK